MNLILQGAAGRADIERIAALAQAESITAIGTETAPHAWRCSGALRNEATAAALDAACQAARLDYAFVMPNQRLSDFKLLAMDMDSTLITIECIDEIADMQGLKPQVSEITEAAMRGEIEFRESLARRVALLNGLDATALQRVYDERLKLSPGAENLLAAAKAAGLKTLLVSGGFTFFTERLKARLGIDHTISNVLEVKGGKLSGALVGEIVDADAKARKFVEVMGSLKARKEETLAIGDGANDLKMMAEAGLSVAFRAKPVVRAQASCALNWCGLDAVVNLFD